MDQAFSREWMKTTTLNPLGFAMLIVLGVALLLLPRRHAVAPFLLMACFVSQAQNVVVFGLSFYLLRTLALVGVVRCLMRREYAGLRWNAIDSAVLAWSVVGTAVYAIQFGMAGLVTRFGWFCDGALAYYVCRCFVRDSGDVKSLTAATIVISVPVLLAFLVEHATGRNPFAMFGGVPAITEVRDGRLRCQGAFAHSILAGCFWASMVPLIASLWWQVHGRRWFVVTGVLCSVALIGLCASSTPVAGLAAAAGGGGLFLARRHMRKIRWVSALLLISLHMVMKAPVWALVQRIDLVGGSTGNFRYRLIDAAIRHFREWCLWGTQSTAAWGWGLQDVCNQYVLEGVRGGAVSLLLFIMIFALSFKKIGRLCLAATSQADRILYWALGVTLFVHCVNFIGVAYFGQIVMLLFLHIAAVASLQVEPPVAAVVKFRAPAFAHARKQRVYGAPTVTRGTAS